MNSSKVIFGLFIAITLSCTTRAESFVRPTGSYYFYSDDKYSNKAGFGIAGGSTLGDQDAHELSLEWDYAKWSYLSMPPAGVVGGAVIRGSGNIQPVLFNYRYRFGKYNSKLRFYAGPSVGFTRVKGDLTSDNATLYHSAGSYSKWSPSYSGTIGIQAKISERLSLDAGCQYLWIKSVDVSLPTYNILDGTAAGSRTVNLGDTKAIVLHLGLHLAF